jgi:hypothetical protein
MPNLRNEKSNSSSSIRPVILSPTVRFETKWKRGLRDSCHTLKYMIHNSQKIGRGKKKQKKSQTLFRETEIICFKIKRKRSGDKRKLF